MERRKFILNSGTGFLGAALFASPVLKALGVPSARADEFSFEAAEQINIASAISNNHGHALTLTIVELVKGIQSAHKGTNPVFDIKGGASHGHKVVLTQEQIVTLITVGTLATASSLDFGHAHPVSITLTIGPA